MAIFSVKPAKRSVKMLAEVGNTTLADGDTVHRPFLPERVPVKERRHQISLRMVFLKIDRKQQFPINRKEVCTW